MSLLFLGAGFSRISKKYLKAVRIQCYSNQICIILHLFLFLIFCYRNFYNSNIQVYYIFLLESMFLRQKQSFYENLKTFVFWKLLLQVVKIRPVLEGFSAFLEQVFSFITKFLILYTLMTFAYFFFWCDTEVTQQNYIVIWSKQII